MVAHRWQYVSIPYRVHAIVKETNKMLWGTPPTVSIPYRVHAIEEQRSFADSKAKVSIPYRVHAILAFIRLLARRQNN